MSSRPRAHIFYSWQSDAPSRTNRSFIESALNTALKKLQREGELDVEPALDRDTQNTAGTPDIAFTIFDKIDQSEVFVCDASIINRQAIDEFSARPTPNPNVLIELGYAAKSLGWDRIIVVVNDALGKLEELPFDIRTRRILTYTFADNEKPAGPRDILGSKLAGALASVLKQGKLRPPTGPALELRWLPPPSESKYAHLDINHQKAAPVEDARLILPAPLWPTLPPLLAHLDALIKENASDSFFGPSPAPLRAELASDPEFFHKWYAYHHWKHGARRAEIVLANVGGAPATQIDLTIRLPEWLTFGSHHHDIFDDSLLHSVPVLYEYSNLQYEAPDHIDTGLQTREPRLYIEPESPRVLPIRHKELLHTYTVKGHSPLTLFALPGAPEGPYDLEYEVFCKELPARVTARLPITIRPAPPNATHPLW